MSPKKIIYLEGKVKNQYKIGTKVQMTHSIRAYFSIKSPVGTGVNITSKGLRKAC